MQTVENKIANSPNASAKNAQNRHPFIQPKLSVNEPGDRYEQEADRMADQVMRMNDSSIGQSSFLKPAESAIQRKCQHCEEEEKLQRKEGSSGEVQGGSQLDTYVSSLGSSGQPLPEGSRSFFEPRFGHDFSNVKIHNDAVAAKSAQSINALAYTTGNNIVFNNGQYAPDSDSGKKLIAHELTHVVQQGNGIATKRIQRMGDPSKIPPMACDVANSSPPASVLTSQFVTSSSALSHDEQTNIDTFAANWTASGGVDQLRIDGYASTPGADELNWQLSCDRAISVANELRNNGVPDSKMTIFAQGETNEFGSQANNQVATISMVGTPAPPPGPAPAPPPPPPAPAPPATGAVFSEDASEQFAGYDNSVAPNWLVVPVTGHRIAAVTPTPAGSAPTYISEAPAIATVAATATGITVTGVAKGETRVKAMQGATELAILRISVKDQLSKSVAFNYVCDSAVPPHCSNGAPPAADMRTLMNSVWERQANVHYTDGGSNNVVAPGDLGPTVDFTSGQPGGGEWGTVTALRSAANLNVFRVNHYMQDGAEVNNGATLGADILLGDAPCADGWGLTHETGHSLGLDHPDGGVMTPCGGRVNQRVTKQTADKVNP